MGIAHDFLELFIKRIKANLYCQLALVGDHFLAIPTLRALKQQGLPLVFCCRKGFGHLFTKMGLVDDFVEIPQNLGHTSRKKAWEDALYYLQKYKFENIISEPKSIKTAWRLKRLRAKNYVGFYHGCTFWVFNKRVRERTDIPDVLRQLSLVTPIDESIKKKLDSKEVQSLYSTSQETVNYIGTKEIPEWLSLSVADCVKNWCSPVQEKYVFLAPGSTGGLKQWDWKNYVQVARVLVKHSEKVALIGAPNEVELGRNIQKEVPEVHNFVGQWTLEELLPALYRGKSLVSNDSGAMHMAISVGLPTVNIFGPTTVRRYRPWSTSAIIVQRKVSCRPCMPPAQSTCPMGTLECLRGLSVSSVLEALSQFPCHKDLEIT